MYKLSNCKNFDIFGNLEILLHVDNLKIKKILSTCNNKTCKLSDNTNTYIIHKSTKEIGKIQCSIFYNNLPMSDIIRNSYASIIKDLPFNSLKIVEVI